MNKNNQSMRPKNLFGRLTQGILLACLMLGFGFAELQAQTGTGAAFYNSVGDEITNEVTLAPGDIFTLKVSVENTVLVDGVTATMLYDNTLLTELSEDGTVTDLVGGLLPFPLFNNVSQEDGKLSFSKALLGAGVEAGSFDYFELEFQVSPEAGNGTTEISHLLEGNDMSNIVHFGVELMEESPSLIINIQGPVDCPDLGLNIGDACLTGGDDPLEGTVNDACECIADVIVPGNDLPCDAFSIECGGSDFGSTVGATADNEPTETCGTAPGAPGVWYSLIGDGSAVTVSLCGSDYDTKLNIYTGTCDALECLTGNDDNTDNCDVDLNQSELTFDAAVGVEYFIFVNGWNGTVGNYDIVVSCVAYDCADLLANVGDACDDGNPDTNNDVVTDDCECVGDTEPVDCLNEDIFPAAAVVLNNDPESQLISTCSFEIEHTQITNVIAGNEYTFTSVDADDLGGYITLRSGTFDGPILAAGFSPLSVVAADDADIFAHWNVDASCNTASDCVTTTVTCSSCVFDCPDLEANIGDSCDDLDETTFDDIVGDDCVCAGTPFDCIDLLANIGDPCDDDNPLTEGDVVTADCGCEGASVIVEVDCDQPVMETYCYGNNEDRIWLYQSEEGSTMNLTFMIGLLEGGWDDIVIYDGDNDGAPVLYSTLDIETGTGAQDLAAMVNVNSTGNAILMTLASDGSVSCQSSTTYEGGWEWTVSCNGEECAAEGGAIEFAEGGTSITVCVDDMEPSMVMLEVVESANSDLATTWVVTDADGNILGLPPTQADVEGIDFDNAGTGNCLIWVLNFDPENSNVVAAAEAFAAGEDVNAGDLEGCFDLSNAAEVVRVNCEPSDCEDWVMYLNNNLGGVTDIFEVDLSSGDAELTYITTVDYQGHIAYNPENNLIYVINNMNASYVTVNPHTVVPEVSAPVFLSMDIASITTAAFAPNGKLLMGTMTEDIIYSVDVSDQMVSVFDAFAPINGGDIAFDSAGMLYLATRAGNGYYEVYPDDVMPDVLIGSIPSLVTGMALTETEQMIMSHKANPDLLLRNLDGSDAMVSYPLMLDGEPYAHADGDMTSGCNTYQVPNEGECEAFSTFYVDHEVGGAGSLYRVEFSGTNADLTLLTVVDYPAHIGYNAMDDIIYLVNPDGSFIRAYDPTTDSFLGDLPIVGDIDQLVAVVYNPADGLLYVGDSDNDEIFTIDLGTGVATYFADAPVQGGDLAIQDGKLYLATRTMSRLREVVGGSTVLVGDIPLQVNGMTQANNSTDVILANSYLSVFTQVSVADASVVTTYDIMLDGMPFTALNGDMAAGCSDDEPAVETGACNATEVVQYIQGTTLGGGAIAANRTDSSQALGVPERTDEMVFTTLGYGGSITFAFDGAVQNAPGDDIEVVETSFNNPGCASYPEYAEVSVSVDGISWFPAGSVCKGEPYVDISDAGDLEYVMYVRISNIDAQSSTSDGFDVDGVVALSNCGDGSGVQENNVVEVAGLSTISSFPNPTNGPSQVVFVTAETGRALVEVFDMNGRSVSTLYNQEAQAGMEYRVDFNGSSLPNGVYIYKLTTNNETIIDKFMIAR